VGVAPRSHLPSLLRHPPPLKRGPLGTRFNKSPSNVVDRSFNRVGNARVLDCRHGRALYQLSPREHGPVKRHAVSNSLNGRYPSDLVSGKSQALIEASFRGT